MASVVALALAGCTAFGPKIGLGGAVTGGIVGTVIGRDLDPAAQHAAHEAEYHALEYGKTGEVTAWKSGSARGEVVAGPLYRVNSYDCRDYTDTITVGTAAPQSARDTACRQANGIWQPVD